MSGIVGSSHNIRGSGLVAKLGTDGQVFTSAGAGVKQTFEDAAGGGAWNLLSTTTASDDATLDITSNIDSTYMNYAIIWNNVQTVSDDILLYIRLAVGGTFATSGYRFSNIGIRGQSSTISGEVSTSAAYVQHSQFAVANGTGEHNCGVMFLYNPSETTFTKIIRIDTCRLDQLSNTVIDISVGSNNTQTAVDGVQFYASSGNINVGTFKLYGIT